MKLIALNKNTEKYGYPQEMEYDKATFNGHQLGVVICVQNDETKEVEVNYLSEKLGDEQTRDFLLGELLRESKAVLITESITQFDEEGKRLVPKTIYFMPYYVAEHSRFKPTIINDNISGACNVSYDIQVEVVFSDDGLSRYAVMDFKTRNVSVMDLVHDVFDSGELYDEVKAIGVTWQSETEDEEEGYVLDFYNEAGQQYNCVFHNLEDLRDAIVSVRMIGIVCHIDGEEDNGDESQ